MLSSVYNENYGWIRYTLKGILKVSDKGFFAQLGGSNEVETEKGVAIYATLDLDAIPTLRQPANAGRLFRHF